MTQVGSEVFTEDGRRAIYAGEIDGQHFVRIVLSREDEEYGTEEWTSDKLTPVSRVLSTAPVERYDPAIEAAQADLEALRRQIATARANVLDLQRQEMALAGAVAKHPDLTTVQDFIEGRITHVAVVPTYTHGKVEPLSQFLEARDYDRADGLKLVCLFGCDDKGVRKWRVNSYRDGSGTWTEIVPCKSEAEAWEILRADFEEELSAWRRGDNNHKALNRAKAFSESDWPDDWREHVASKKAKDASERLAKLREEVAALEAEQVPA